MKLTVVTACYNSGKTLRTTLESVLAQRDSDYEYLVIDGASTDDSPAILQEYEPRFQGRLRWISEPDAGLYDAINKGIRLATGDFVGILNSDDAFSSPDILSQIAATLAAHPQIQVVYGDIRFVPNRIDGGRPCDLSKEPTLRYYSARHWRRWMLRWGYMPPHPSIYIRRDCFERLGFYKTDYRIAADNELLVRFLYKAKLPALYLKRCIVDMRVGGVSTKNLGATLLLNREIVRGHSENGYFCCLPMLVPKYGFKVFEVVLPRLFGRWRR